MFQLLFVYAGFFMENFNKLTSELICLERLNRNVGKVDFPNKMVGQHFMNRFERAIQLNSIQQCCFRDLTDFSQNVWTGVKCSLETRTASCIVDPIVWAVASVQVNQWTEDFSFNKHPDTTLWGAEDSMTCISYCFWSKAVIGEELKIIQSRGRAS